MARLQVLSDPEMMSRIRQVVSLRFPFSNTSDQSSVGRCGNTFTDALCGTFERNGDASKTES